MKEILIFIMLFAILFTGCGKIPDPTSSFNHVLDNGIEIGESFMSEIIQEETSLLDRIDAVEPNNLNAFFLEDLFVDIPMPEGYSNNLSGEVFWPDQASCFSFDYDWIASADSVSELLFTEGIPRIEAPGQYTTDKATLIVKNQAIRFNSTNISVKAIKEAVPYTPADYPTQGYQEAGISKSDYSTGDLSFMTMLDASNAVKETLEKIFPGEIVQKEGYALDEHVLNIDLQKKLNYMKIISADVYENQYYDICQVQFTEEDECYFFTFQVRLADLLVMDAPSTTDEQTASGIVICCLYGNNGILDLTCERLPSLIWPEDQIEKLASIKDVANTAVSALPTRSNAELISMECCYAAVNKEHRLQPVWTLCSKYEVHLADGNSYISYDYIYIDAITSEVIKNGS